MATEEAGGRRVHESRGNRTLFALDDSDFEEKGPLQLGEDPSSYLRLSELGYLTGAERARSTLKGWVKVRSPIFNTTV